MTTQPRSPLAATSPVATLRAHIAELRRALDRAPTVDLARALLAGVEALERECARLDAIARPAGAVDYGRVGIDAGKGARDGAATVAALGNGPHEASTAYALLANERAAFEADVARLTAELASVTAELTEQRETLSLALANQRSGNADRARLRGELADATNGLALVRALLADRDSEVAERDRAIAAHVAELAGRDAMMDRLRGEHGDALCRAGKAHASDCLRLLSLDARVRDLCAAIDDVDYDPDNGMAQLDPAAMQAVLTARNAVLYGIAGPRPAAETVTRAENVLDASRPAVQHDAAVDESLDDAKRALEGE